VEGVRWLRRVEIKKLRELLLNLEKLNLQAKTIKMLGYVTIGCVLLGVTFARILTASINTEELVVMSTDFNQIYIVDLGIYETYEEILRVEGKIKNLGYGVGINLKDDNFLVFSHIVDGRIQLEAVEETLLEYEIPYEIQQLTLPSDELKWDYFFKLVHQIPYEMEAEFIEEFGQDEMFILGYYVALSDDTLDVLSIERQQMLREIYQWLNTEREEED